jgi:sugar phosphate isomerase/epimerase
MKYRSIGSISRRALLATLSASVLTHPSWAIAEKKTGEFKLNYMLASCMYGKLDVKECISQASRIGATSIDLWPPSHGDQRNQIDSIGHDHYIKACVDASVKPQMTTRYDLGPFGLKDEIKIVKRLGGKMIVCGSTGNKDGSLKEQVAAFIEKMRPHVAIAEEAGLVIAIENHSNALIHSPDSLKYFADLNKSVNLGIALAPYHLPQDGEVISDLIKHCDKNIVHFYAWEHGMGCHRKMQKTHELMQLPGFGTLDFTPILAALRDTNYHGFTEIFMHPSPRGIPIMPSIEETNGVINESREYLARCIQRIY